MKKQHKLFLALVLSLLTFTGQTGLAMAKITCFCLNKSAWAWQWDTTACPFEAEAEAEATLSCAAEKSCCAASEACTADSPSCNDECLQIDMSWFNAGLEAPSITVAGLQDVQPSSELNNYTIWFSSQQVFSFSGQYNLPPPPTSVSKHCISNLQARFCTWLC